LTTKEGIESWWALDGFAVEVRKLDLRPAGELLYSMTATGPEQIEFMKNAGCLTVWKQRPTPRRGKALKPGHYRALFSATEAAGTSKP
jgi:hypothetical protein